MLDAEAAFARLRAVIRDIERSETFCDDPDSEWYHVPAIYTELRLYEQEQRQRLFEGRNAYAERGARSGRRSSDAPF